jgi:hypothetical protein
MARLNRIAVAFFLVALTGVLCAGLARESVIRVFPAWPKEWDAAFTLLARGAFMVSSSMEKGQIEFVEIRSNAGGECRLRNPWPDATVTLDRNGKQTEDLSGSLLKFPTTKGDVITIRPSR